MLSHILKTILYTLTETKNISAFNIFFMAITHTHVKNLNYYVHFINNFTIISL